MTAEEKIMEEEKGKEKIAEAKASEEVKDDNKGKAESKVDGAKSTEGGTQKGGHLKEEKVEREKPIPKKKLKAVEELSELAKEKKTIMIASIKNIPASQFQEIGKKLRGKAIIKVPKKNLIFRAIDASDGEELKKLKENIHEDVAILFSDLDAYELAGELVANKTRAKAKPGQEAPEDIVVEAGGTDLLPGPALSELGAVGLKVAVEQGKIAIKESHVIAKKGEKISASAADVMSKLDMKPFTIGFVPLVAFDTQEKKLYTEIKIDREATIEELKTAFGKALPFAVEIGYANPDTIKFLLSKAGGHEKALSGLVKEDEAVEEDAEVPKEGTRTSDEAGATIEDAEKVEQTPKKDSDSVNKEENSEPQSGEANVSEPKASEEKKEEVQTPEETKSESGEDK